MEKTIDERLAEAWQLFDTGRLAEAERLYNACRQAVTQEDHGTYMSVLMGQIYVESFLGKFDEARNCAVLLRACAQNAEEQHIAIHQAGMVERLAENYTEAKQLFKQEAAIMAAAFPEDAMSLSVNLYEQAYIDFKLGEWEQAEKTMRSALAYADQADDAMCKGCAYRGLGEIRKAQGNRTQAGECFEKAIIAFEEAGDSMAVAEVKEMMK